MTSKSTPIFIGSAWCYANGSLHIGHVAALLPADILARFFRLEGHDVLFVSGSDCHGTPISVKAEKEHIHPKKIAEKYHAEFTKNFASLGFSFSEYIATYDPRHTIDVQEIFVSLYNNKFIYLKNDVGIFCEKDKRFLPDRYIEGECPICHFEAARGDQCDNCGNLLDPLQLIKPICKICGSIPISKSSKHFYFRLSTFETKLKEYIGSQVHVRKNTKVFIENFLRSGIHDRAISRDIDWGVPIPLSGYPDKRIYVWFEAVCGYLTASKLWGETNHVDWKHFWGKDAQAWYVYGKDNIPFHTILWPAILSAYNASLHLPDKHIASEYLQIEHQKISTSRNWAIWIPDLLKSFTQTQIRYGLIAMGPENSDTNFSWDEFEARYNNEFIATCANYIQRTLNLAKQLGISTMQEVAQNPDNKPESSSEAVFLSVAQKITNGQFRAALQDVISFASDGNKLLDREQPWKHVKDDLGNTRETVQLHLLRAAQFGILLDPFLPEAAKIIRKIFSLKDFFWKAVHTNGPIEMPNNILFPKIERTTIEQERERLYNNKP